MNTSFFGELMQTISERGRALLARNRRGEASARSESLVELCEDLLSGRGEASVVALAREILGHYSGLTIGPRIAFFEALARRFGSWRSVTFMLVVAAAGAFAHLLDDVGRGLVNWRNDGAGKRVRFLANMDRVCRKPHQVASKTFL